MADISVNGAELRASAGLARGIVEDLAKSVASAVTAASTAVGQLAGWSVAGGVQGLADTVTSLGPTAQQDEQWAADRRKPFP
ncbi:hypothetical protein [Kitasatospora azatica]|uniref:hypothetical protein n=1 Tax=Kitasatospora azatica TaxID=58347 RepID=UPI000561A182|nr:hypothetical protein [Kitasatospora azatica]